jgi:hypothetical protein
MRQVVLPETFYMGLKFIRTESHGVQLKQEDFIKRECVNVGRETATDNLLVVRHIAG